MYQDKLKIVEDSDFAYIIAHRKTKNILAGNKLAKIFYSIDTDENFPNLGEIFKNDNDNLTNLLNSLSRLRYIKLLSLKSNKNTGEQFDCDVEIRFFEEHEDIIYLVIKENHENDELIKRCIDLTKKVEMDQQYFDVMQDFSKNVFFRINVERKTMIHRGDISKIHGLVPVIENYPESMLENGVIHNDDLPGYMKFANDLMSGIGGIYETRVQLSDRTYEWYRLQGKPIYDNNKNIVEMVGKSENIQKLVNARKNTDKDLLTSVLTKTSFEVLASNMLELASDTDNFALVLVDVDGFKNINDKYGHVFGDFLLQIASKRLSNSTRSSDKIGRVGTDQFAILFNHVPNKDIVFERAKIIKEVLNRAISNGEYNYKMEVSIGISFFPNNATNYNELFYNSLSAIKNGRKQNNNQITFYE